MVSEGYSVSALGSCIDQTQQLLLAHVEIMKLLNQSPGTSDTKKVLFICVNIWTDGAETSLLSPLLFICLSQAVEGGEEVIRV